MPSEEHLVTKETRSNCPPPNQMLRFGFLQDPKAGKNTVENVQKTSLYSKLNLNKESTQSSSTELQHRANTGVCNVM